VSEEGLALADRFFHEITRGLVAEEGLHARGRADSPVAVPYGKKFFEMRAIERLLFTEQLSHESNLGKVLDRFHLHICGLKIRAVGDNPMVRHENGVEVGDKRLQGLGQLGSAGSAVWGEWNLTEADDDFTDQRLVERDSGSSESGGSSRMSMNDGIHVRAHAVDQQVHADLTGDLAAALELSAFHVHDDEIGSLHHALGHASGSNKNAFAVQPDGQVPVSRGNKPASVQKCAAAYDFTPKVVFRSHVPEQHDVTSLMQLKQCIVGRRSWEITELIHSRRAGF